MPKAKSKKVDKVKPQETMESVKTLTLPGFDIDILYKNDKIGYTFQYNGQNYGTAVKPESKDVADIAVACLLLIINAQETFKELERNAGK
jgi:hypothetical protein